MFVSSSEINVTKVKLKIFLIAESFLWFKNLENLYNSR